jgi:hypothetical protein
LSELIDGRWYRVNHFEDNFEHFDGCPACTANNIMDEYEEKFPQARQLLRKASNLARDRGYVHTLLGRRRRYPEAKRLHSALNAIIQGSAADYFKLKLIELYNEREFLGIKLRMPVHDEFVYDCNDDDRAKRSIQELLDTQSLSLCVPLLWESGFGKNWREANMGGPPLTDDQGWMRQSNAGEGKSPYPNPTPEEKSTRSEIGDQHGPV